ncbi:glycosyltransferase family 2 protein [Candidatus Sumerlaeota bacterium]|nr:glycosyltransferase family 2 protein [Candidatus Sumerlaeota bacterium]
MVQVAIQIVSWNCREVLRECLYSLRQNLPQVDLEIIVIDNASSDSTSEMIKKEFPEIRFSTQSRNLGFAKANNLALSMTGAEYLFILNPDTRIFPGTLEALSDFLDKNPDVGLAAPQIVDENDVIVSSVFRFPSIWNYWIEHSLLAKGLERIRRRKRHEKSTRAPREIDWATGAAFLARRSALEGEPLFDERFFLYSEDADLCLRLKKNGWKRRLVPASRVCHLHRQSSKKARYFTIIQLFVSMDLYFQKHKSPVTRFLLRSFICVDMILRLILIRIYPGKESFQIDNNQRKKAYREILRRLNPLYRGKTLE